MERAERAPIAPERLALALAPFGESRGLPSEAYVSTDVFAWERERFFEGSWTCLGRTERLREPGARRAFRVGGETVVASRGQDGVLRAFFNVCRHRGHELVDPGDEPRPGRAIVCPYHGWTYGLDGALRGAPGFDPPHETLAPVRVAEWCGYLFADISEVAPPFEEHSLGLDPLVSPYEPERLRAVARVDYDVAANWKLIHENYHECYHCSNIHPELCRVTPPDSGRNLDAEGAWVGGSMDLRPDAETMSLSGESQSVPLPGLDDEARRRVLYLDLFPNVLLSLHPDYVLVHRLEPLEPGRTFIECEWLFPPEALQRNGFDPTYAVEFWDLTNRQDWRACESVQRGVSSRAHRPGVLGPREDAVYRFLTLVARGYLDGRVTRPSKVTPARSPT